jgi:hypothetical protein
MSELDHVFQELLRAHRVPLKQTSVFSRLLHNSQLVPALTQKSERIVGMLGKYHNVVYDIQGPADAGVDVLIRQDVSDAESEYFCLQVKSHDDLRAKDWLKTVKAAYFDARQKFQPMIRYILMLCIDGTSQLEQARRAAAEFSKDANVLVVAPEQALGFFELGDEYIEAVVNLVLSDEDFVFRSARSSLTTFTPFERAVILWAAERYMLGQKDSFTAEELLQSSFLSEVHESTPQLNRSWFLHGGLPSEWREFQREAQAEGDDPEYSDAEIEEQVAESFPPEDFSARIAEALEFLEDGALTSGVHENYRLPTDLWRSAMAVMLDGNVRYGLQDKELLHYTLHTLGPNRAMKIRPGTLEWPVAEKRRHQHRTSRATKRKSNTGHV